MKYSNIQISNINEIKLKASKKRLSKSLGSHKPHNENINMNHNMSLNRELCVNYSADENTSAKKNSNGEDIDLNELNIDDFFGSQLKTNQNLHKSIAKELLKPHNSKLKVSSRQCEIKYIPQKGIIFSKEKPQKQFQYQKQYIVPSPNKTGEFFKQNDLLKYFCHGFVDMLFGQKEELNNIKSEIQKLQYMFMMNQEDKLNNSISQIDSNINQFKQMYHSFSNCRNNKESSNINNNNYNEINYQKEKYKPLEIDNANIFSITKKQRENVSNRSNKLFNKEEEHKNNNIVITSNSFIKEANKQGNINKKTNVIYNEVISEHKSDENEVDTEKKEKKKEKEKEEKKEINIITDLKNIKDDEFDQILANLKKNKKVSLPSMNNPFIKSGNFKVTKDQNSKKKKSAEFQSNSKKMIIKSDFLCGGQQVSYNPNSKTLKLLKEMEKDVEYVDDLDSQVNTKNKDEKDKITQSFKSHNKKRNYIESIKDLKDQNALQDINIHQIKSKTMKMPTYKIDKQQTKETKEKIAIKNEITLKPFPIANLTEVEYYCLCQNDINNSNCSNCTICQGKQIINILNFHLGFHYFLTQKSEELNIDINSPYISMLIKDNEEGKSDLPNMRKFLIYQYRFLSLKCLILSSINKISYSNNIIELYYLLYPKFKRIYFDGKRSYLMKVAEKDASVNNNMILLILNIKKVDNGNYVIEFSDGYKSAYCDLDKLNPICVLIENNLIYIGMKLNIGLSKLVKITENFDIYINIFYNSITPAGFTDKLGLLKKTKFILKNLLNIKNDGGEISMLNIIVIKKYDYFINDIANNKKYCKSYYDKILEDYRENRNFDECIQSSDTINAKKRKSISEKSKLNYKEDSANISKFKLPENIIFHFRLICSDALLYYSLNNHNNIDQSIINRLICKKCYIDFSSKSIALYDEFNPGKIYRIMLLNINKKIISSFREDVLVIKANDSIIFNEEKGDELIKKEDYNELLDNIKKSICVQNDYEICKKLEDEKFSYEQYLNEEFKFYGIFISKYKKVKEVQRSKEEKDAKDINELYLLFMGLDSILILLKIHSKTFFDLSLFEKNKSKKIKESYKVFTSLNVVLKSVCYFDQSIGQFISLGTIKEKLTDKAYYSNILISLETTNYSSIKVASKGDYKDYFQKDYLDKLYLNLNKEHCDKILKCI